MSSISMMALPELEGSAHELEGAAPTWRGAYSLGEAETEAFFENLAEHAVGGRGPSGLARVASLAANSVYSAGGVPLAAVGSYVDGESGLVRVPPLVVMEHFGHAMAEAESEHEAEAFLPLLLPLAAKALPMVAKAVLPRLLPVLKRAAPRLIRGATNVLRTLRRNPATRPLVRVVPTIVRRTVADITRDIGRGRPVTSQAAVQHLGTEVNRVLANPHQCVHAYRRSRALDRRYHQVCHIGPCR